MIPFFFFMKRLQFLSLEGKSEMNVELYLENNVFVFKFYNCHFYSRKEYCVMK